MASLDHFSLTDSDEDDDDLVPQAVDIAARTDVALTRVTCLLGMAGAVANRDHGRSIALVRAALTTSATYRR